MNVYDSFSLNQLISILEKQPVTSVEKFFESFYHAMCKELNVEPFKIEFVDNININNRSSSKTAICPTTCDQKTKTIFLNRTALKLFLVSQNALTRLHPVIIFAHECRHSMQIFSPSTSLQHTYASLCSKFYKLSIIVQFDHAEKLQRQLTSKNVCALEKAILGIEANSIVRNQMEFQQGYFNFPWEIDAREFSLQFVDGLSSSHPMLCELINSTLQKYSISQQNSHFSMLEFIQDSQQFVHTHKDCKIELVDQMFYISKKIKEIYRKNGIKTKEDEAEFVKKLFPKSFSLSPVQTQSENQNDKNKEK